MKSLLALLTFAVSLHAQSYRYSATTGDVVLSAQTTKFTIQQTLAGRQVTLEAAVVYCSVACDVSQSVNGTAATATAGTVTALPPVGTAASSTVWTASNVGSGTSVGGLLHIAGGAGTERTLDLSRIALPPGSTASNYTIAISSITGTANITLYWREQ